MDSRGINVLASAGSNHSVSRTEHHARVVLEQVHIPDQDKLLFAAVVRQYLEDREHAFLGIHGHLEYGPVPNRTPASPFQQCNHLSHRPVDTSGRKESLQALNTNQGQDSEESTADRELNQGKPGSLRIVGLFDKMHGNLRFVLAVSYQLSGVSS
jgi:hypothetical protein